MNQPEEDIVLPIDNHVIPEPMRSSGILCKHLAIDVVAHADDYWLLYGEELPDVV